MISAAAASQLLATAPAQTVQGQGKAAPEDAGAPSAIAAADQKIADEKDALGKLQSAASSAKASPSALAKAKLKALQQRLKMLMLMGGDPKMVAREAARIAKEIGQAAKAYADATGGSDSGATSEASSDAAAAQQDATQAASAAQGGDASSPNAQAAGDPSASDPPAIGQAPATDPAATDPSKAGDPAAAGGQAQTQDATKAPQQPPAQTLLPPVITTVGPAAVKTKLPDPIIEEARVLEASAKAIAQAAIQKLKAQHKTGPHAKTEQEDLDKGEADFKAAAKEIYGDTGVPSSGSANDSAGGYDAGGAAVPASPPATSLVSVQA
ncbi:MAG: hypothetical protein JSR98_14985 [Proteobacteria bacterium]|nr:hypothetical protein [Pseudomonadota bacterium]